MMEQEVNENVQKAIPIKAIGHESHQKYIIGSTTQLASPGKVKKLTVNA